MTKRQEKTLRKKLLSKFCYSLGSQNLAKLLKKLYLTSDWSAQSQNRLG